MTRIALVLLLAACGGSGIYSTQKIVRHGEAWFSTRCGRASECIEVAEEICPGGYKEDRTASEKHELLFTCTAGRVNWKP